MSVVAFVGMYLLLKKTTGHIAKSNVIIVSVSLLYCLLPFWSFTMSVAGLPIVFFAFLNLRSNNFRWYNWVIICLFPFYSSLVLSGFFLGVILGVIFLLDVIRTKRINLHYLGGVV
jgi:hypothetical protein